MKKNVLRAVKILSLLLAITATLGFLQEFVLCHADHNRERIKGFYDEDKNSLDVVILGASEVYSDFAPGYAYEHSGVTSYLFATQANTILNYKSELKNILDRQDPDLIVIELNGALYGNEETKELTAEANLRNYADNVPLDSIKIDWLKQNQPDNVIEYLFPIIKYHGVWEDFPDNMVYQKTIMQNRTRGYNYLKGVLNETGIFVNDSRSMNSMLPDIDDKEPLEPIAEKALRELLQYCKDEGLTDKVVFARFPHIVVTRTYNRYLRNNTVADIVAEYGFDYINLERDFAVTGLDETTDFYNLDHLNVYGQKKFTAFFTDYLTEHYGVKPADLSNSQKDEWEECARYYGAYYRYSDELIQSGDRRELSEDCELIDTLQRYL